MDARSDSTGRNATDSAHAGERGAVANLLRALCLLLALCLATTASARQSARLDPVEVEGAFLVNFLRYTQWPGGTFASPDSPYILSVVGSRQAVERIRAVARAAGRIDGRPIEVVAIDAPRGSLAAPIGSQRDRDAIGQLRASHLVYFHSSAGNALPEPALSAIWGEPVLTVSNLPGFASIGGMLGLTRASDRIVFEANPSAIRHARLLVSAKVFKLARARRSASR